MDISVTYIKMCEKAEEIQEGRKGKLNGKWENEDYFALFGSVKLRIHVHSYPSYLVNEFEYNAIWLPSQAQLQEMIIYKQSPQILIRSFNHFCNLEIVFTEGITDAYKEAKPEAKRAYERKLAKAYKHQAYIKQFTSMEQLWLAFVMKEKYGKVWSGTDWVMEKS